MTGAGVYKLIFRAGDGQEITGGDQVVIHHKGTLENGKVFDSSDERGPPFIIRISRESHKPTGHERNWHKS